MYYDPLLISQVIDKGPTILYPHGYSTVFSVQIKRNYVLNKRSNYNVALEQGLDMNFSIKLQYLTTLNKSPAC